MRPLTKQLFLILLAAALLPALAAPAFAQSTVWEIDPAHSTVQFSVRHLMISNVRGEFGKITGTVRLDESDLARSAVEVTVDATTINTHEPQRDAHLRSGDFLNVANFPTMTFRSKRIAAVGSGKYKLTGDLTIRGVTREVTFDVEGPSAAIKDPWGNVRAAATATARINRKDFGVSWNAAMEAGGVVVGDEVNIAIDLELVKKADVASAR